MTQGDIHNLDRVLQRIKTKILKSEDISDRDKDILIRGIPQAPSFLSYMQSKGHSLSRMNRYLQTWKRLLEDVEWQIEEVDKTKLTNHVGRLQTDQLVKKNGEPFSESTKREIKKGIRKMYTDYVEKYKDNLDFPKDYDSDQLISFTLGVKKEYTDPERLPTPPVVKELVENTTNPRDKAYLMLLWSTGGRHGEILGLKWKDVRFDNNIGRVIFKDTKTGGDHQVPMAEAYPFMFQHRENDPRSNEPNTYVFRSMQSDEQISGGGAANIIKRTREKEEVDIPSQIKTNPHAFRKGRTSYWARQEQNESWICKYMNWAPGSDVVRHYCRVAQNDIEQGVFKHLGLDHDVEADDESQILTPCECHSCGTINGFQTETCMECGEVLETSNLYKEAKIQEMKAEVKNEMIERETGKTREDIRQIAEDVVEKEI